MKLCIYICADIPHRSNISDFTLIFYLTSNYPIKCSTAGALRVAQRTFQWPAAARCTALCLLQYGAQAGLTVGI